MLSNNAAAKRDYRRKLTVENVAFTVENGFDYPR